jgi:hypothetical protein
MEDRAAFERTSAAVQFGFDASVYWSFINNIEDTGLAWREQCQRHGSGNDPRKL